MTERLPIPTPEEFKEYVPLIAEYHDILMKWGFYYPKEETRRFSGIDIPRGLFINIAGNSNPAIRDMLIYRHTVPEGGVHKILLEDGSGLVLWDASLTLREAARAIKLIDLNMRERDPRHKAYDPLKKQRLQIEEEARDREEEFSADYDPIIGGIPYPKPKRAKFPGKRGYERKVPTQEVSPEKREKWFEKIDLVLDLFDEPTDLTFIQNVDGDLVIVKKADIPYLEEKGRVGTQEILERTILSWTNPDIATRLATLRKWMLTRA